MPVHPKKRILLYYQNSAHSVCLESVLQGFTEKGYECYLLTTTNSRGILHDIVSEFNVKVFFSNIAISGAASYLKNIFFLVRFCRQHKIDIIYSHLQNANLIALIAEYIIKARVVPCRHHMDDVLLSGNKNGILIDKLVSVLSKKIVVVSNAVKQHMILIEQVDPAKITVVPLGYNFDLYDKPNASEVAEIKSENKCSLLLIIIGRMVKNKNHIAALRMLLKLKDQGLDVKMLILDNGVEKDNLLKFVVDNNLENDVCFTGFLNNINNHLQAADILICPSISEASNQVVKEAGFLSKPSIVVAGVGDFDEYITHGSNGFVVSKNSIEADMVDIVSDIYNGKYDLDNMGKNQKEIVQTKFDIKPVVEQYLQFLQ